MKQDVAGGWMKMYNEDKNNEFELSGSCNTNNIYIYASDSIVIKCGHLVQ